MRLSLFVLMSLLLLTFLSLVSNSLAFSTLTNFRGVIREERAPPAGQASHLFSLNFDPSIEIFNEKGFFLNSEVCEGSKINVKIGGSSGEWLYERGGYEDSPPIFWVDDLDEVIRKIQSLPAGGSLPFRIWDGYVDEDTGIPVYEETTERSKAFVKNGFGTVICESAPSSYEISGAREISPGIYEVTGDKKNVDIDMEISVRCVFYHFGHNSETNFLIRRGLAFPFGVYQTSALFNPSPRERKPTEASEYRVAVIRAHKSLVVNNEPPRIEVKPIISDEQISPYSSTFLKVLIENVGNKNINLMDLSLNTDSNLFICNSKNLPPGSSTECVFSLYPKKSTDLLLSLNFKSNECGEMKKYSQTFSVGKISIAELRCEKDEDCGTGRICCRGSCEDPRKGVCVDIDGDGIPEWVPTGV
jgi:hypothetical protein